MEQKFNIGGEEVRRSKRWPNYGTTRTGKVYRLSTGKRMTPVVTNAGYYVVRTCHDNFAENAHIHWMIADCWLHNDNPESKTQVNHKNGNKLDYSIENLEWVTLSQNQRHALDTGLKARGEDLYNSQLTRDQVHLVCQRLADGMLPKDVASIFDVSTDIIRKIKSGDSYPDIRVLYDIDHEYKNNLSEATVRWVCERIREGLGDVPISKLSTNKLLNVYEVKRIRNKMRYKTISSEYF